MTIGIIPKEAANRIDWIFERYFDDIADEIAAVARKHDLTTQQVTEYVRYWYFEDYYEEWIAESD